MKGPSLLRQCPIAPLHPLPRRTAALPGCGGQIRVHLEDFEVEEVPKYLPSGSGEHLYLWIEKRDVSGTWLKRMLANSLGISARDIGMAGLKDRRAVTRQWISVPKIAESKISNITGDSGERVRVLDAALHGNKLRTGHLHGNRFRLVIRGVVPDAHERVSAKVAFLAEHGQPNFYGSQRMGHGGSTLAAGWALSRGEQRRARVAMPDGAIHQINLRDRQLRRLAASALQSEVFNRVLQRRMETGCLDQILLGDVCRKRETGGTFNTEDVTREQTRLDAGELVITGPMWGPKMRRATEAAGELEADVLAASGLDDAAFSAIGHLAAGTRRPMVVWPTEVAVEPVTGDAVSVRFTLPAGSFATVFIHELIGPLSDAEAARFAAPPVAPVRPPRQES